MSLGSHAAAARQFSRIAAVALGLGACAANIDEPADRAGSGGSSTTSGGATTNGGVGSNVGAAPGAGDTGSAASGSGSGSGASAGSSNSSGGTGAANGGASNAGAGAKTTFTCDTSSKPSQAVLRRLTMTQYRNTLADLLAFALADAAAARTALNELAAPLGSLPEDRREPVPQDLHGSYRRLDQTVQQIHVDATYDVALAVGAALTTAARLSKTVGSCAGDTDKNNDAACLDSFLKKFGARALRRPLTAEELTFYKAAYGSDASASAAAYADLIGILLTAPEFLYFVEHGGAQASGQTGVFELSAYELASRLSYQLWQTAPDDALLAAAESGALLDPATYEKEVRRLLADPRAKPVLDEFFADWMKVEDLPDLDAKNQDVVFKAFAGADLPKATLRQAMIDDVLGLLDYHTWTQPSGVAALFATELSLTKDTQLAKLYGVPAWDGTATPPSLPAGQRPGLLTRALFLSTGTANTRPIMKGVFIRKNVLCTDIPPPPPGANAMPPVLEPGMTTRESVAAITEMSGTVCAGCHTTLINPLGYATENFDALGRFRSEQKLFDDAGRAMGSKPVDTHGVPQVTLGDRTPISSPAELMQLIAQSGQVEACLARNYFRFTYARWEDTSRDGCTLEASRAVLASGGSIADLLRTAALAPEFRRRAFE